MSLFLKWFLRYRYPKYQRAYRLVFDPDGFHHYPKELKAQLEGTTKEAIFQSLQKTLQPYVVAGKETQTKETIGLLSEVTLALPQILDVTLQLANWNSLARRDRKHCIALVAYLISPVDIIPEGTFGGAGFADDVIFASVVFNAVIAGTSEKFVSAFWKGDKKIFDSLCAVSSSAKETLPELHKEVTEAFQAVFA